METPFHALHHICIVVNDIDTTTEYYRSLCIGPWHDFPPLTDFTDLTVPNPAAFLAMKYRYANLDNVQLQLCQPPMLDCPQRRFLESHGEGVFHLGFEHNLDHTAEAAKPSTSPRS